VRLLTRKTSILDDGEPVNFSADEAGQPVNFAPAFGTAIVSIFSLDIFAVKRFKLIDHRTTPSIGSISGVGGEAQNRDNTFMPSCHRSLIHLCAKKPLNHTGCVDQQFCRVGIGGRPGLTFL